jgi:hypothetical protein
MSDDDIEAISRRIAEQLGEQGNYPLGQVMKLVARYGTAQVQTWLEQALAIEAQGGQMTLDGQRRTPGGVFFAQAKQQIGRPTYRRLMRRRLQQPCRRTPLPGFDWEQRENELAPLLAQKGTLSDVRIMLVGRPGATRDYKDCVITVMQPARGPSLPRGLPPLPEQASPYIIYISRRHWETVADQLADESQVLVVEGWAAYDPRFKGLAVFAMTVSTRPGTAARPQRDETGDSA